ncbi:beta-lactamase-like protein [Candidatus Koribacter versatilis Ellin345]|uniref:Beta-lactamase-like protein n=1 Tax=Koribacter versatilis (strain Ellin345) TaxID=204669 RepID=Q1IQZ0_KORVE|nr:MBL fold metallo-hydrolase [Candidatus Koribacter versatilis]ABF40710.1 beta-lactamase-like protein [Candidatus Koribacter versatilis Ellin345]
MRSTCTISSIVFTLLLVPFSARADSARKITKLAEGVYAIEHPQGPAASGNTTVIIGDRQVFVVDTCFLPSVAQQDIATIRTWTDKPVAFILNTHFHNDHNIGNRAYLDAYPAATIIATTATKKAMDMFGPSSSQRFDENLLRLRQMLATGKTPDGNVLTNADKAQVQHAIDVRLPDSNELHALKFQSATLAFDHDFTIDLGHREVQVKFLGRGNTEGDAIVFLPREKIVVAGDLVVYPLPYIYDGYPSEWVTTLEKLAQLDWQTIIPGHGPVMHDKSFVQLEHDLLRSALDQMDAVLVQNGPALSLTLDQVKPGINLSSFRQRFAGDDPDLGASFDDMTAELVKAMFSEASLR